MDEFTPDTMRTMWYAALKSEFGARWPIFPEYVNRIMTQLYTRRQELKDPELECLSIYCPLAGDYIYIYHKAEATLD